MVVNVEFSQSLYLGLAVSSGWGKPLVMHGLSLFAGSPLWSFSVPLCWIKSEGAQLHIEFMPKHQLWDPVPFGKLTWLKKIHHVTCRLPSWELTYPLKSQF